MRCKNRCKVIGRYGGVLSLIVLALSVLVRTLVTIIPDLDTLTLFFGVTTRPSHICCLAIWCCVTFISCYLIWEIISNGSVKRIFSTFRDLRLILSVISVHAYEIWMFTYIYNTYVVEFEYFLQLLILFPLFTLLALSFVQISWPLQLSLQPGDRTHIKNVFDYARTSLAFNLIMTVHVVCMALTSYLVPGKEVAYWHVMVLLGIAEVLYRLYIIRNDYILVSMYCQLPEFTTADLESGAASSNQQSQLVLSSCPCFSTMTSLTTWPTETRNFDAGTQITRLFFFRCVAIIVIVVAIDVYLLYLL